MQKNVLGWTMIVIIPSCNWEVFITRPNFSNVLVIDVTFFLVPKSKISSWIMIIKRFFKKMAMGRGVRSEWWRENLQRLACGRAIQPTASGEPTWP